ncbi:restriction endonuclease subunit S [Leeuwenhoekiella sp. MAR_2009_132]|uniref:restriction endonuclease subunit S n=1 Tax=Leeuwenhoekiella sp. MAR_2009_132 TaxID=1392489 RepID=UPI00068FE4A4|nr:restriction endonuclease subunit S [Leeuwenhoekiella sp. MAR_2009_132]
MEIPQTKNKRAETTKGYEHYKDSGVEWLGEIPVHWKVLSFRYIIYVLTDFTANGSFGDLAKNVEYLDFKNYSRLIRLTDLRKDLKNDGIYLSEKSHNFLSKSELQGGELLMANVGAYAGLAWIMPYLKERASLGPNMFLIKLIDDCSIKYFELLINSLSYKYYIQEVAKSSAQPKLNKDNIRQLRILFPPRKEQTAIAQFLYEKTEKIDAAVALKEQQIKLLQERKQILIHKAVTRGLDDSVAFKDSSVEWIGAIPEHWDITAVKYLLEIPITDGPHTTPDLLDEGIPFISAEAIKNGEIDFNKKRGFISEKDHQIFSLKYLPKRNDIYMVKSGATTGNIAMVKTDEEFSIWSPLAVFRSNLKRIIPKYLYNYLESPSFKKGVELSWSFGTQQNIGMGVLSNLPISYPPISEQREISEYIETASQKIETAISLKQQEIEKLKEYKSSLINSVVTGKVKVF